jgi:hypothetical protein
MVVNKIQFLNGETTSHTVAKLYFNHLYEEAVNGNKALGVTACKPSSTLSRW